jgi:5-methylcytosine-specific restriction endonuclease McrA
MWNDYHQLDRCADCGTVEEPHLARGFCSKCYYRWRYYNDEDYKQRKIERACRYQHKNLDKVLAYHRRYYEKNREKVRKYYREYRVAHRDKTQGYGKRYYESHREQVCNRIKQYRNRYPSKVRIWAKAQSARRRALLLAIGGHATVQQIIARIDYYGKLCYICKKSYGAIDHVIPLSKGGTNWPANLRPICKSCNHRKYNKSLKEFLEEIHGYNSRQYK